MAKMFYTLEEAAAKLGMSTDDVQGLVESGQLQEFRDRDNLMFKVDQVDLLGGDDDDDLGEISLADTAGGDAGLDPISLSATGTGTAVSLEASSESTGISIFDGEDADADANAETLVSGGGLGGIALGGSNAGESGFGMDAGASGSGLAQLAFEPDDTSLGGNLLDDLASDSQGASAMGASALGESAIGASLSGGALFEGTSEDTSSGFASPAAAPMPMMQMGEQYDGPASGLFGGIALGAMVVLLLAMAIMILAMNGGSAQLLGKVDQNMLYTIMGGGAGAMIIFGGIGWAMLRKS